MNRVLLDTQVFLWWLLDDPRLTQPMRAVISAPITVVHVSAVSIWEIAIKQTIGRLPLIDADLVAEVTANGFIELPINGHHGRHAGSLPMHHRDPFDRMLIAQAQIEALTLVSSDRVFTSYDVPLLS